MIFFGLGVAGAGDCALVIVPGIFERYAVGLDLRNVGLADVCLFRSREGIVSAERRGKLADADLRGVRAELGESLYLGRDGGGRGFGPCGGGYAGQHACGKTEDQRARRELFKNMFH